MKIGILTGGGDCPGLNSVIRGVVRKALSDGQEVIGLRYGWKGLLDKDVINLYLKSVSGIPPTNRTIFLTFRTNHSQK